MRTDWSVMILCSSVVGVGENVTGCWCWRSLGVGGGGR